MTAVEVEFSDAVAEGVSVKTAAVRVAVAAIVGVSVAFPPGPAGFFLPQPYNKTTNNIKPAKNFFMFFSLCYYPFFTGNKPLLFMTAAEASFALPRHQLCFSSRNPRPI
jgi:hypothetical protein